MRLPWLRHIPWVHVLEHVPGRTCDVKDCKNIPVARYNFDGDKGEAVLCEPHLLARGLFSCEREQARYDEYVVDHPQASHRSMV
jgi:hypothetical protein